MTTRERLVLGGILAVALVLRVAWCFHAARLPAGGLHDPNFYYLYGQQLANGLGYRLLDGSPTAYYPPGYPMALAPFILVTAWTTRWRRSLRIRWASSRSARLMIGLDVLAAITIE